MESKSRKRNEIKLPTIGAELFTYLKDVNDHESFTASMRLKDLLANRVKQEINSWFKTAPLPELDQTLLRKITNSLLSAGLVGQKRTKDALSEIRFESQNMILLKNLSEATDNLRDWARDYRSAKGFLDYQYKCVNSFLRVQKTTNDETVRSLLRMEINGLNEFKIWQEKLEDYWSKKGLVKENLRTSYKNLFHVFMGTFDDQLQNGMYHSFLDQNWQRYIGSITNVDELVIPQKSSHASNEKIISDKSDPVSPFEVDLRIEGGEIFYHIICKRMSEFQASELRFKIAIAISKNTEFAKSRFSVSILTADLPIILIRTDMPDDEAGIRNVVTFLEQVLEENKSPR